MSPPSRPGAPSAAPISRPLGRIDWVHLVVAVLVALAIPPVGLLLALYWASKRHQDGEPAMTAVMLVVAALAAAAIFAPEWFFSHLLNI